MSADCIPRSLLLSPTEERNIKSNNLCIMSTSDAIDLMVSEESSALVMILEKKDLLEELIDQIVSSIKLGGRLIYVGAGTSGRLAMIDASECQSTFAVDPTIVQGIIAGGTEAIYKATDCAEETFEGGLEEVSRLQPTPKDTVVAISASGQTPFTWGSLAGAKRNGSFVSLITFNPFLEFKQLLTPDLVLPLNVGPEVLTGSTRLKCGTVTKCLLNMISTLTMVKLGRVHQNLMINLHPVNTKLRERSIRIVMSLFADVNYDLANQILQKNDFDVRKTIEQLQGLN